jgi:hypothetical protein
MPAIEPQQQHLRIEATALLSTLGTPLFRVYSYLRVLPLRPCFYRATAALPEEQRTDAFALLTTDTDNPADDDSDDDDSNSRPTTTKIFLRRSNTFASLDFDPINHGSSVLT